MDLLSMLRTLGALGLVLGMLAGALWAVRRYDLKLPGRVSGTGRRRVELVERLAVDAKRSVALIRRDGCEHLVLIGPEGHVTLETGIAAPAAPAPEAAAAAPAKVENDLAALKTGFGKFAEKLDFRAMVDRFRPDPGTAEAPETCEAPEAPELPAAIEGAEPTGPAPRATPALVLPVAANDLEPLEPAAEIDMGAAEPKRRTRAPRNTTRWNKRAVREALDA